MNNNLTLHIMNTIPWSNLNRDDSGTPKRAMVGGALRGMLSSQSIKRAARSDYETRSLDQSVRSTNLAALVSDRALEINPELDRGLVIKGAKRIVSAMVKKSTAKKKPAAGKKQVETDTALDAETTAAGSQKPGKESDTSSWLSREEIETAAAALADRETSSLDETGEPIVFVEPGITGSLSIAAFGRMFAYVPKANTAAAIAVSPALSVHRAVIETDYFSTVDDHPSVEQGAGASFLGVASYTSGVFYRSVTIDRSQLRFNWTGFDADTARERLALMVEALVYKLPSGKKNATAPYVAPLMVLAEEQSYRLAYDFETPVLLGPEGGYGRPAVKRLAEQRRAALSFDPENFGRAMVAGTADGLESFQAELTDAEGLVGGVVDWILA